MLAHASKQLRHQFPLSVEPSELKKKKKMESEVNKEN